MSVELVKNFVLLQPDSEMSPAHWLCRSKIAHNDPKMFSRNEIEISRERGRTMSLTEVLIEMGLLSPTEVADV